GSLAPSYPPGWRITVTVPSGAHWRTTLPTTSLNQSTTCDRRQRGPSVKVNPPASFSIAESFGTRASNAGSNRTILPTLAGFSGAGAGAGVGAGEQAAVSSAAARISVDFIGCIGASL